MRVPIRKAGKYTGQKCDPYITQKKYNELKAKLARLKQYSQLNAIKEVKRLASDGDFSENAAYSMAKGRLRGINRRILEIENMLKQAVIIDRQKNRTQVEIGCQVTVEADNQQKTFTILGSSETDPDKSIISHNSPIGKALLGHKTGDKIKIKTNKIIEYRIIGIK